MLTIGCDYHPGLQHIAFVDTDTGELSEARLEIFQEGGATLPFDDDRSADPSALARI